MEYTENSRELFGALVAFRRLNGKFHNIGDLCLSEITVFSALMKISDCKGGGNPIQMLELSREIEISKPALSQIVNKLEDKGLVVRSFSKEDRRATYLHFTDKGREIYHKERDTMINALNNITQEMGEGDTQQFVELLKKFHGIVIKQLKIKAQEGDKKECQDC